MHLARMLDLRPIPAAGVAVAVTRRCPLACRHCSTASLPRGEQYPDQPIRRFVASFADAEPPGVLLLTGGEPLLRPRLVTGLATAARRAATASCVVTGMFFATPDGRPPAAIERALMSVDHVVASVDRYHQEHVPLANVFAVMRRLTDAGRDVSFQVTASGPATGDDGRADENADTDLARTIDAVRDAFDDRVPMLVGRIEPVGRAVTLAAASTGPEPAWPGGEPCAMAAWPVVRWDGSVVACANQLVLDAAEPPEHLTLGHLASDDWPAIRERVVHTPHLRSVRTIGPGARGCADCRDLHRNASAAARTQKWGQRPAAALVEAAVRDAQSRAGAVSFARRYGSARYASLVELGADASGVDAGGVGASSAREHGIREALCDA